MYFGGGFSDSGLLSFFGGFEVCLSLKYLLFYLEVFIFLVNIYFLSFVKDKINIGGFKWLK